LAFQGRIVAQSSHVAATCHLSACSESTLQGGGDIAGAFPTASSGARRLGRADGFCWLFGFFFFLFIGRRWRSVVKKLWSGCRRSESRGVGHYIWLTFVCVHFPKHEPSGDKEHEHAESDESPVSVRRYAMGRWGCGRFRHRWPTIATRFHQRE